MRIEQSYDRPGCASTGTQRPGVPLLSCKSPWPTGLARYSGPNACKGRSPTSRPSRIEANPSASASWSPGASWTIPAVVGRDAAQAAPARAVTMAQIYDKER